MIQITMKCKFCGELSFGSPESPEDYPVIEFDFREQEIRCLCKKCKKDNVMLVTAKDTKALPSMRVSRGS